MLSVVMPRGEAPRNHEKDEVRARSVSKVSHHPCLRCGLGQDSSFILHPLFGNVLAEVIAKWHGKPSYFFPAVYIL